MKHVQLILKWGTTVLLLLSAMFFFLPYVSVLQDNFNPIGLIQFNNDLGGLGRDDFTAEITIGFIIPAILTFISALFVALKTSIAKRIICSIFNAISIAIYIFFFNNTFLNLEGNVQIGLTMNIIIASIGIAFPIISIIVEKISNQKIGKVNT